MTRFAPTLVLSVAAIALLSGCVGEVTYTVAADEIATTAANALEEQVGSLPEIDCGTEEIELVKGKVIDCVLTDPVSGDQFDAPVTIEEVDGPSYTIGIQVADAPR